MAKSSSVWKFWASAFLLTAWIGGDEAISTMTAFSPLNIKVTTNPTSPEDFKSLSRHGARPRSPLLQMSSIPIMDNNSEKVSSKIKNMKNRFRSKFNDNLETFQRLDDVGWWRATAAVFLSLLFIFNRNIDTILINAWKYMQTSQALLPRMFRHDHWEWMLAVSAFFICIHGYYFLDKAIESRSRRDLPDHRWRRYRLQDQRDYQCYITRKSKAEAGGQAFLESPPKTKLHKWHAGAWLFEVPLYMVPLYIWDIMCPRRARSIATWGAPTSLQIMRDVTLGLAIYDMGFFICHYLFHKVPLLYQLFHKKHHTTKEIRACDQVRLSLVEEVVDVGISIIALRMIRAHPFSRTIYNFVITYLLVELHSGYAFPWSPQEVVPFNLATGSRGHHFHHRNGRHYYQKFFCTFDRIFGFVDRATQDRRRLG